MIIFIPSCMHAGDGGGCFHDRDENTKITFYDMDNSQTILLPLHKIHDQDAMEGRKHRGM